MNSMKALGLALCVSLLAFGAADAKTVKKDHHSKYSGQEISAVQTALNANGEKVKVDGKWGKLSRAALKDYQKSRGMKVNGRLDAATLKALNVSA